MIMGDETPIVPDLGENTENDGNVNVPDSTGTQVPDTVPEPQPMPEPEQKDEPGRPGPLIGPVGFSLR
jgi:hypothetical protein